MSDIMSGNDRVILVLGDNDGWYICTQLALSMVDTLSVAVVNSQYEKQYNVRP